MRWIALTALSSSLILNTAYAQTAVLIWPIDPVIEHDQKASALWLQNQDKNTIYLQVRVQKWMQNQGEELYVEQNDVMPSPPILLLEPGKKQLIRLVKTKDTPANQEQAYRIFVDEIPRPDVKEEKTEPMGLKFQMRYSIPLFVSGEGIWTKKNPEKNRDISTASQPNLSYSIMQKSGKNWIQITNQGNVHARLSQLTFVNGGQSKSAIPGLLGYVLPGAQMSWQLPDGASTGANWQAKVKINDNEQTQQLTYR